MSCEYCDPQGLPCLKCARIGMKYTQASRRRCGFCAVLKRPPEDFPPFKFCPYCGEPIKHAEEDEECDNEDD